MLPTNALIVRWEALCETYQRSAAHRSPLGQFEFARDFMKIGHHNGFGKAALRIMPMGHAESPYPAARSSDIGGDAA
jgi:hypothetical protein